MIELKPCPFCGIGLESIELRGHWMYHHPLTGTATDEGYHKGCILDDHTWPIGERNIELWNRRAEE